MWGRFAKTVLGTDNVDAQLGDGLPAEVVLGLPRAVISDLDHARGIVLLGPDLKEELPVLHLRVRRAAVDLQVPVVEIAPRATGLTREASAVLRHAPGEAATIAAQLARALAGDGTASGDGQIERAVAALDGREGDLIVVLGRQSLAESADAVVAAAAALAELPDVKFLSALRRGNVHGALDMGLAPGFAPGRVLIDGERGLDATGILTAVAAGEIDTLVLLGADLLSDFPDRGLVARRARRRPVRDRGRRVRRRRVGARRCVPPHAGVGGEERQHDEPRGPRDAAGPPGHPRGNDDGRLADRRRARPAVRHRLRARHRRGRAGRDRPRGARVRGCRRRAARPRA